MLKKKLFKLSLTLSAKLRLPSLAAFILARKAYKPKDSGTSRVLCLSRSVFEHDIAELRSTGDKLDYMTVPLSSFAALYDGIIKGDYHGRFYHASPDREVDKEALYRFMLSLLPKLQSRLKFDAILSANFHYSSQQELCRAARELNIPFFVLYKEGLVTPEWTTQVIEKYRACQFIGTRVLFFNKHIRNAFLEGKIKGFNPDNTRVVGTPRMDKYFREKTSPRKPNQYLLFAFEPMEQFKFINLRPGVKEELYRRSEIFHLKVMKFIVENPELSLIIKVKAPKNQRSYVETMIKKEFGEIPQNLTFTASGSPCEMIKDSAVIFGCNSLALIEACIMDRPIIIPNLDDLFPEENWNLFGRAPELVHSFPVETELGELLRELPGKKSVNGNAEIKKKLLEDYIGPPDGCASKRVDREIIEVISEIGSREIPNEGNC